jgi:competence CoiA-like predicted nuclease
MALEATKRGEGKRVKLWRMTDDQVRQLMHNIDADRELMTCVQKACGCSMYVKALDSDNVVTHFARFPETGQDRYHPNTGESVQHKKAKERLAQDLQAKYPKAEVTTEHRIDDEMEYSNRRRIDVYVEHPNGRTEAHELQFAYQTTATTERRTRDYKAHGIDAVIWWWGDQTADNWKYREWCIKNCSHFGTAKTIYEKVMGKRIPVGTELKLYDCQSILDRRKREAEEKERARQERINDLLTELKALRGQARTLGLPLKELDAESLQYDFQIQSKMERLRSYIRHHKQSRRTRAAKQRRNAYAIIGEQVPTGFNGLAKITSYDPEKDLYQTSTGLWWKFKRGRLVMP